MTRRDGRASASGPCPWRTIETGSTRIGRSVTWVRPQLRRWQNEASHGPTQSQQT
jgi:hypothetical protein